MSTEIMRLRLALAQSEARCTRLAAQLEAKDRKILALQGGISSLYTRVGHLLFTGHELIVSFHDYNID